MGIIIIGLISLLAYAGLLGMDLMLGTLREGYIPQSIGLFLLAFLAYVVALIWVERFGIARSWLWFVAVSARILLIFTTPSLSDDVYRMLWDGHVANQGISPYALPIDSPDLDHLDVPARRLANNTWMASPYLPSAQGIFFGLTALFPLHPVIMQATMVVFDLLSALIISRLLALAFLPDKRLIIYLWNPLVIIETAHGAHIDAWMVLLSLTAVYMALRSKPDRPAWHGDRSLTKSLLRIISPLFLTLATLTKPLPVLFLPVLFWCWNWSQRLFYGLALILILLPFGLSAGWGLQGELDGRGLFGAILIYAAQWQFNSGLFHWLESGLIQQGVQEPLAVAKAIVLLAMLILLAAVWLIARRHTMPRSALRLMAVPLMGYVLLTPTFHPWYLLILLAFVPFLPPGKDEPRWLWLSAVPWIYLSGVLIFSYLAYLNPLHFEELEWVRQIEWLPTITLLILAGIVLILARSDRDPVFKT